MDERVKELSDYRLEKARRNLNVAQDLIDDGFYDFAVNRAYYAAFDAMRAVNALDGFDSSKHSGVISHFNQFYVKTGIFKPETSAIIKKASLLREKSDYEDFFIATREDAEESYYLVGKFVEEVDIFLHGSRGQE